MCCTICICTITWLLLLQNAYILNVTPLCTMADWQCSNEMLQSKLESSGIMEVPRMKAFNSLLIMGHMAITQTWCLAVVISPTGWGRCTKCIFNTWKWINSFWSWLLMRPGLGKSQTSSVNTLLPTIAYYFARRKCKWSIVSTMNERGIAKLLKVLFTQHCICIILPYGTMQHSVSSSYNHPLTLFLHLCLLLSTWGVTWSVSLITMSVSLWTVWSRSPSPWNRLLYRQTSHPRCLTRREANSGTAFVLDVVRFSALFIHYVRSF